MKNNDENANPQLCYRNVQASPMRAVKVFGSLVANTPSPHRGHNLSNNKLLVASSADKGRKILGSSKVEKSGISQTLAIEKEKVPECVANETIQAPILGVEVRTTLDTLSTNQTKEDEQHSDKLILDTVTEGTRESFVDDESFQEMLAPQNPKRKREKNPSITNLLEKVDLKRMEEAVLSATESVNTSLNAVRKAKEAKMKQKMIQSERFREDRRAELEEIQAFNNAAEQQRRGLLELKAKAMQQYQKDKAQRHRERQESKLQSIIEETNFKSEVHREHQRKLKQDEERRRRESTEKRAKIRIDNKRGKEKIKMQQIEEENAIFEERHESSLAMRKSFEENAEARRKSFAFRNGDAKRIRELLSDMRAHQIQQDHEGFELKWAGEKDAEEYIRRIDQQRRESLAFRNQEAKRIRQLEESVRNEEIQRRQQSHELKWAGEKDTEEYLRKYEQDRRDSLAFRNQEGRRIRQLQENDKNEEILNRQQSNELKWAAEKDAEEYKRKCEQERRESLVFRNQEGRRIRHLEENIKNQEISSRQESNELKWAGERDAEEYKRLCEQERRQSLEFRNKEGARHRAVMEELVALARQQEHESLVLKWAGENDVKEYLKEVDSERRASLAFRNKEGRRVREIEQEMHVEELVKRAEEEELQAACK